MKDFNERIQPFLDHYEAYKRQEKIDTPLKSYVESLNPDNTIYISRTPFQALVEHNLERDDPELWDWYYWMTVVRENRDTVPNS